jgi:hypothetical protein
LRLQDEPILLFLYDAIGAMREPLAASHFGRVCAGSITKIVLSFRDGPKDQTRDLEIPGSPLRIAPE